MRRILMYPGEDGLWIAECPSLPGTITQGHTRDEAMANIREAIDLMIEVLREHNEPVPDDYLEAAELVAV
jgi:predicted RNase H-like HicB family nuclease